MSQLTLDFNPALPDRFPTLREYIAHRSSIVAKKPKEQAADMDLAPSTLSRKLNPAEGDTQRFNVDDLERWLASTGDATAIVDYLAAKYLDNNADRQARLLARLEGMLPEIAAVIAQAKGTAA